MNPLYVSALQGTLVSKPDTSKPYSNFRVSSSLKFSVSVYSISTEGKHIGWTGSNYMKGGDAPYTLNTLENSFSPANVFAGDILLITSAHSGGFLGVIPLTDSSQKNLVITSDYISAPNDIGPVPVPTKQVLIPGDSPRVVVGSGSVTGGNSIVREQYWRRVADSYSLAPGAKKQVSYTLTTGMQSTTSQQDTVAASLGLNASAGWGPISASVSASLTSSSTTFQQQTYTTQSTTFTSLELSNDTEAPQTLLVWQLTDIVTIFDSKRVPLGSIVTGSEPSIIYGPYSPLGLIEALPLVTAHDVLNSHGGA